MHLWSGCRGTFTGSFIKLLDEAFPRKLEGNPLREYGYARRYYCKLYHTNLLSEVVIWSKLNELYQEEQFQNYYQAWHQHYPNPHKNIFNCERYIGRRCGGRGRTICTPWW